MKLFKLLILSTLILTPFSVMAASSPYDCGAISNKTKRLKCYDGFFKDQAYKELPPAPEKKSTSSDNEFGKEQVADLSSNQSSISTEASGEFKNWNKGLEVELANGQVWELTEKRNTYYKITDPKVEIEKGFLSVYYMHVEGLNRRFKVKRIK